MKLTQTKILIILTLSIIAQSCSSVKNLEEGQQLVVNEVFVKNKQNAQQEPISILSNTPVNKKIFGIPIELHLYNLATVNPERKFNQWLNKRPKRKKRLEKWLSPKQVNQLKKYKLNFNQWLKKTGEAPSLVEEIKINETEARLKQYYQNLGYFTTKTSTKIDSISPNKASITYNIETGPEFTLGEISRVIASKDIDSLYLANKGFSFINEGEPFVVEKFDDERERLINLFRDNGIYNFQQRSIRFKAFRDTLAQDTLVPVVIEIKNAQERIQDSLKEVPYLSQKINSVSVFIQNPEQDLSTFTDSINFKNYQLYSIGKLKYNPQILVEGITIKEGMPYSYTDRNTTYRYFNDLQNFKYPTIVYTPTKQDSTSLDASIYLSPKERFSLGFDADVSHSNIQDIGITLGSSIISRNLLREAEVLEFGVKGTVGSSRDVAEQKSSFFNLFEIGGNLSLRIPRLVAPNFIKRGFQNAYNTKTNISLGVSFQENIGLDRQNFTWNFEYNWKTNPKYTYNFKLVDIEFVNNNAITNYFNVYRNSYERLNSVANLIPNNTYLNQEGNLDIPINTDAFIQAVLEGQTSINPEDEAYTQVSTINERKQRLTANNFIIGSSFTFLKNTQQNLLDESFSQFRFKLELVGNFINSLMKGAGVKVNENGNREIFNLAPSQYVKTEFNYIKHWQLGREHILAFRSFGGIAIPYGNANSIPFTRSYYAGGSNDNRAWKAYKLGPGSSNELNEFNEANLKLAFNIEYRFPLVGPFKGALFIDSGNIWNFYNNVSDASQNLSSFEDLKQLAVGTGFGIRYDFDYFVFRLDTAFKTYDPSMPQENRWGSQIALKKAVFNIGINYPF